MTPTKITIVMYHYVRELRHSRFPEIKGLDLNLFSEQIDYLQKHYQIVSMERLIAAIEGQDELPPKAALLTFDDAYLDHYINVFPLLDKKKLQGSFFPPVRTIMEHTVLDVNKIHFILASVENKHDLISEIYSQLDTYRAEYGLGSNASYYEKLAIESRFDTAEVIFIKRLLQRELPEELRNLITDHLFRKFVTEDEKSFSRELYMNVEQIKCMQRNGMHIGSHGFDHYWLASLSKEKQETEIRHSLAFLDEIGCDMDQWTMCYPYGNYNEDTIAILKAHQCRLGLTTHVGVADISGNNRFELPRLDTNDLPKQSKAATNEWYLKA